jgi:hypothetical protein
LKKKKNKIKKNTQKLEQNRQKIIGSGPSLTVLYFVYILDEGFSRI